jgi:RNA-binding protein Nova
LGKGQPPGRSAIGQRQSYPGSDTGSYASYFESGTEHHQQQHEQHNYQQQAPYHSIQSIPEGSPARKSSLSPSPYSSTTTTGTTTTPTSIEHNISSSLDRGGEQQGGDNNLKGHDFRESYSTGPEVQHWASVDTRFASSQQHQQTDLGTYVGPPAPIQQPQQQQHHYMQEQHQHPYQPQHQDQQQQVQEQHQHPYQPQHQDQQQQELLQQPAKQQQQGQGQARYNPANFPIALKLLVSNNVAGSIIGRAGQTISELQSQSTTRIKLSQTGDYYPGSQDRVCLVQGEAENIKSALRLLLERFHMLQEHQHSQHMAWQLQKQKGAAAPVFDFVVRILVPSSSCGMIIGKSGSNIKFLEDSTGVSSVRLSPKETTEGGYSTAYIIQATSERVVTVTGPSLESCLQCLFLILDGMAINPDICRYANMTTSYSRVMSDAYQAGAGRPVLVPVPPTASPRLTSPEQQQQHQQLWEGMPATSYVPTSIPRRSGSSPDLPGIMSNQRSSAPGFATELQTPERLSGYSPVLNGPPAGYSPLQAPAATTDGGQPLYLFPQDPHAAMKFTGNSDAVSHSASAPDLLALQLEQSMHISSNLNSPPSPSPGSLDGNGLVPQAPTLTSPGCFTTQVLVPDSMIGSILGRGGHTLTELQMVSGTRIRISQRGEYMPGTRSRIVTIRGPTAQTVWQAQYMMSQRIVLPPTATYSQQHIPSQQPPPAGSMPPSDASRPQGPSPAPHGGPPPGTGS